MQPRIFGRSSSHFTRTVRVFAHELDVPYAFRPVLDLRSHAGSEYAGNPALKLPVLETDAGNWFGALNICRELARRAPQRLPIVWPEDLRDRLAANAQELVVQGMATEVALIMQGGAGGAASTASSASAAKARTSLVRIVSWLDEHVDAVLNALPAERALSFYEVTQFCFITHLEFRGVMDVSSYARLASFCREFAARPSAQATVYRFDA